MPSAEEYKANLNHVLVRVSEGVGYYDEARQATGEDGIGLVALIGGRVEDVQKTRAGIRQASVLALRMSAGIDQSSEAINDGWRHLSSIMGDSDSAEAEAARESLAALYASSDTPLALGRSLLSDIRSEASKIDLLLGEAARRLGALQDIAARVADDTPQGIAAEVQGRASAAATELQHYGNTIGTPLTVPGNLQ